MAKPNMPEMQKTQQSKCKCHKNNGRSLTEASWRHCYFFKLRHNKKCWLSKNGCTRLVCECYICLWLLGNIALHEKRRGARTDSWGTPYWKVCISESSIFCYKLLSVIAIVWKFMSKFMLWSTASNANYCMCSRKFFLKSKLFFV